MSKIGRLGEFWYARHIKNGMIYLETFLTEIEAVRQLKRIERIYGRI